MRAIVGFSLLLILVFVAGLAAHLMIQRKSPVKPESLVQRPERIEKKGLPESLPKPSPKPSPQKSPEHPRVAKIPPYEVFPEKDWKPVAPEKVQPPKTDLEKPRVAIIIDDLGFDSLLADKFLALDENLTFSVLPHSPYHTEIAKKARARDLEMLLHLPMEPLEYPDVDPGPGALLDSMSPDELILQLEANLDSISGASGVNNHMGSKLTQSDSQMHQIFTVLKKRNMFFVDSHTTKDSVCRPAARLFKIPFAQRDVFIDHYLDDVSIRKQLKRLVAESKRQGSAIGIAHPHDITFRALEEQLPLLKQEIQLVPVSRLVKIPG